MSSVLRSVRKRKKGRTLGAVDVIDREGYAELEVDAKVELIRSLIPLGLMHIEELLDEEVPRWLASATPAKTRQSAGAVMGATPGRSGWPASACRFACPGFAMSHSARFHCGRTKRCMAIAPSMTCCCGACCMGSRAATTRRPPRRFPGRSACRGRRCPARSFRPARRNSANSSSGTSPGRTLWPSCWTARRSPRRRWSSRWASR